MKLAHWMKSSLALALCLASFAQAPKADAKSSHVVPKPPRNDQRNDQRRDCFRTHLRDAIQLNRERAPLYAELTRSESVPVSAKLIQLEKLTLAASHVVATYDRSARPFQEAGINIVCDDFVDMRYVPAFRDRYDNGSPEMNTFVQPHASEIKKRIRVAMRDRGFRGAHEEALRALDQIDREPRFNCLLRHSLESIARIAALAPRHHAKAKRRGLPSPGFISKRMIDDHLVVLRQVMDIDWKAAPIQARGVPIICQDVPQISIPEFR